MSFMIGSDTPATCHGQYGTTGREAASYALARGSKDRGHAARDRCHRVLGFVGAGTFGLGYLLGRHVAPRPRTAPNASPATVLVPKVLHLSLTGAVQHVLGAELAIGKVETRTGGEPGTIVAQFPPAGTSASSGSQVNLFVSTSLYPKGAFEQCPVVAGTLPLGRGSVQEAEHAALRFARAFLLGDWRTVRVLLDPSALPLRKSHWAIAGKPARVQVFGPGINGGTPVAYGCGPKVARRTVAVVLDDGTTSASADFNLYLVRRADGWKVWASY